MPKAYLMTTYRAVHDPAKLAAYAALSKPAIEGRGGRILARGDVARAYESGAMLRAVIVEFDSAAAAVAAYESPEYRHAMDALDGGAERDIRVIEGV